MMGFSIFCQKFILPVGQNTTTKFAFKEYKHSPGLRREHDQASCRRFLQV
jgi:hypothetical protein